MTHHEKPSDGFTSNVNTEQPSHCGRRNPPPPRHDRNNNDIQNEIDKNPIVIFLYRRDPDGSTDPSLYCTYTITIINIIIIYIFVLYTIIPIENTDGVPSIRS